MELTPINEEKSKGCRRKHVTDNEATIMSYRKKKKKKKGIFSVSSS